MAGAITGQFGRTLVLVRAIVGLWSRATCRQERASDPLWRAWKAFDWDTMGRLYDKDCIFNPVGKAKSVTLTAEGERRCRQAYYRLFTKEDNQTVPGR